MVIPELTIEPEHHLTRADVLPTSTEFSARPPYIKVRILSRNCEIALIGYLDQIAQCLNSRIMHSQSIYDDSVDILLPKWRNFDQACPWTEDLSSATDHLMTSRTRFTIWQISCLFHIFFILLLSRVEILDVLPLPEVYIISAHKQSMVTRHTRHEGVTMNQKPTCCGCERLHFPMSLHEPYILRRFTSRHRLRKTLPSTFSTIHLMAATPGLWCQSWMKAPYPHNLLE